MALRVWLPLNGNLNNQGLSDYNLKTMGTEIVFNTNGKIGKSVTLPNSPANCLYIDGGLKMQDLTWTCWFKSLGAGSGTSQRILSEGRDTGNRGVEIWLSKDGLTLNAFARGKGLSTSTTINTWHHVALVAGDAEVSLYLDGILINTVSPSAANDYAQSSDAFVIGKMSYSYTTTTNYFPFNGYINDVRVYDECLSPKQIKEISKGLITHYKLDGPKANENIILRSDTITSGSQASGITRTYMNDGTMKIVSTSGNGNYASIGFAENSDTNVGNKLSVGDTYTISCDIKVEEGTTFPTLFINSGNPYRQLGGPTLKLNTWQRVYYTNTWNEPGTSYRNIALHLGFSGAIGTYYFKNFKLEKGNFTPWIPAPTDPMYTLWGYDKDICVDVSGNGYTATKNGALTFNTDSPRYSGSIKFDSGYLHQVPSPLNASSDAFTISCWFYPTQNATMCLINDRKAVGDGLAVFYLSGGIRFDTGSSYQWQVGTITVNAWNHVVVTWDKTAGNKKLYLNGSLINTTTSYGTLAQIGDVFSIGNSSTNGAAGAGNQIYGSLSDFRIYAIALSADDIKELYQTSAMIDNQGNAYAYEFKEE